MTSPALSTSVEKILELNPQIDRQVVRRWQRLNEQIIRLGGDLVEVSGEYRIEPPFGTLKRTPPVPEAQREIRVSRLTGHFGYGGVGKPGPGTR